MTREELLASLRADATAFGDAVDGIVDRPVPSCPGWTVADLVWHLGEVHLFWRTIAGERLDDWRPAEEVKPDRPADADIVAWYRSGVDELLRILTDTDPSTPVWTWTAEKNVGFIVRRMAQETAVHRWDAEAARGTGWAIDPAIAVDGIDEFLEHFLPNANDGHDADKESVHLHCTDTDGEWLIVVDGPAVTVTSGHAKGDAAARGSASDLLLLLWRRVAPPDVDVVGDAAALDRFLARTNLD